MAIAKPVSAVTRQGIFSGRGSIFTVKPCLVPVFRVDVVLCMREINFFSILD